MIYPIVMYGDPVLRRKAQDIEWGTDEVKTWVANMFETTAMADGVGLAAPQIGKSIRLFIVDSNLLDSQPGKAAFKKAFINPEMVEKSDTLSEMEEGCLSIPGIRESVSRPESVRIKFFDTDWKLHEEEYKGMKARIIQHEYDHLEGVLFTDYLSSIKKRLLRKKLTQISKGEVEVGYNISAPIH